MNVGKIIKVMSIILFFVSMIVLMYICTLIWSKVNYENVILYFVGYTIGAILISFINTILLYGFGDLIDTNNQMLKKTKK